MPNDWNKLTPEQKAIAREYWRAKNLSRWLLYLYNGLPLPTSWTGDDEEAGIIVPPPPPPPPDDKP